MVIKDEKVSYTFLKRIHMKIYDPLNIVKIPAKSQPLVFDIT